MAVLEGFVQETCEPKYLALSTSGTCVPSMKYVGGVLSGPCNISVFVKLRAMPYNEASDCTVRRNSSICGGVIEIRSVSSAYSRSYTGLPGV